MPAVPDWNTQFDLTAPCGNLIFNVQSDRLYLLDKDNSSFEITVRQTTSNVPQSDGSIPHHRFLTGTTMTLMVHLLESDDEIACDELLAEMLDDLTCSLRSLLNAGDNEGRLAWAITGGQERMLDDVRLSVYPAFTYVNSIPTVTVTIDSEFPYAQDLTPTVTPISDGNTATLTNTGSAEYFPVFRVNELNGTPSGSPCSAFTITNVTTAEQFVYDSSLPGAIAIPAGSFGEINTFRNTIYRNGNLTNLKAGVDELNSEYFSLALGANQVAISGCDMDVEWAPAYG